MGRESETDRQTDRKEREKRRTNKSLLRPEMQFEPNKNSTLNISLLYSA